MIKRIVGFVLILCAAFFLFGGCGEQIEQAEGVIEKGIETVREAADRFIEEQAKNNGRSLISKERAKEIAITYAGVTCEQITDISCEHDIENGIPTYDVEFSYKNTRYKYKINAENGEVMSFDMENR